MAKRAHGEQAGQNLGQQSTGKSFTQTGVGCTGAVLADCLEAGWDSLMIRLPHRARLLPCGRGRLPGESGPSTVRRVQVTSMC